jgi:NADH-quinone oxidoreductase subunit C
MKTLTYIQEKFQRGIVRTHSAFGDDTIVIERGHMLEFFKFLKSDEALGFNVLMDLCGVDYHRRRPRYEVVYHLLSLSKNHRLRVKVAADSPDPEVDSLTDLWATANWYEREVWDMFGIRFKNHPNLKRILMYEEFKGHPLRKDYPVTKRQPLVGTPH